MSNNTQHPTQPSGLDNRGVLRFKANKIVRWLLDAGPFDMNVIAVTSFDDEDRRQFAQLIGYSVDGYQDLNYATCSDTLKTDDIPDGALDLIAKWRELGRRSLPITPDDASCGSRTARGAAFLHCAATLKRELDVTTADIEAAGARLDVAYLADKEGYS